MATIRRVAFIEIAFDEVDGPLDMPAAGCGRDGWLTPTGLADYVRLRLNNDEHSWIDNIEVKVMLLENQS